MSISIKLQAFALGSFLLLFCCTPPEFISIRFPQDGAVFLEDDIISFVADQTDMAAVVWRTGTGCELGRGSPVFTRLIPGDYVVTAQSDLALTSCSISVIESRLSQDQSRSIPVPAEGKQFILYGGIYSGSIVSLERTALEIEPMSTQPDNVRRNQQLSAPLPPSEPLIVRDLHFTPGFLPDRSDIKKRNINLRMSTIQTDGVHDSIGTERTFIVADVSRGLLSPGFDTPCTLIRQGADMQLWIETGASYDETVIDELFATVIGRIRERDRSLWGEWGDVDGNGYLNIILTAHLNNSGLAIGFFNPADFFSRNDDSLSSEYNPTSNEGEFLYCGIPESSGDGWAYTPASITATVAHELYHLILTYRKSYLPYTQGNPWIDETVWVQEGCAHLTEALCGLGASGGNALFIEQYSLDPGSYSIDCPDRWGREDSAGQRGLDALLFWWLGNRSGIPVLNGVHLNDDFCSFYRQLSSHIKIGWELIQEVTGQSKSGLLTSLSLYLDSSVHKPPACPDTGELLGPYLYEGAVSVTDTVMATLTGPARTTDTSALLANAITFLELLTVNEKTWFSIVNNNDATGAILNLSRK